MRYHVEVVWKHIAIFCGERDVVRGERTCAGAKVIPYSVSFHFTIAQLKLRTQSTTIGTTLGHSFSFPTNSAFLIVFFFCFLGQLVASEWFWPLRHTYP